MTPLHLTGSIAHCGAARPNGGTGRPSDAAKGVAAAAAGEKANSPKRASRAKGGSAKGAAAGASGKAVGRRGAVQAEKGDGKFTFLVALALQAIDQGTNGIPVSPRPGAEIKRPQTEAAGAAGIEALSKEPAGISHGPDAKVRLAAPPGQVAEPGLPALAALAAGKSSAAAVAAEGPKPPQAPATGVEAPEGKPHGVATPKAAVTVEQAGPVVEVAAGPAGPADPQQPAATAVAQAMSVANGSQAGPTDAKAIVSRPVEPLGQPGGGAQTIEGGPAETPRQAPARPSQVLRQAARVNSQTPSLKEVTVTGRAAPAFGAAVRTAVDAAGQPVAGVAPHLAAPAEQAARTPTTDVHQPQADRQAGPITESVTQQIAAQVRTEAGRASQRVVIQLQPPELGRVRVTFRETDGVLHGELKFSDPEALAQARLETPGLIRQLAEGGVRVRQMDVSLAADGSDEGQLNWMGRDGQGRQQQDWGDWLGEANADAAGSEEAPGDPLAEPLAGDPDGGAINLWV